jgi:hypothetical protein
MSLSTPLRIFCILIVFLAGATVCLSQAVSEKPQSSALVAAVSYAQSLAQWEFAVMGGSLLVVIGTSHQRPPVQWIRVFYLLFLPGWISLGISIWFSTRVQGAYMAYLALPAASFEGAVRTVNADLISETRWMLGGLVFFFVWVVAYLLWWTFTRNQIAEAKDGRS